MGEIEEITHTLFEIVVAHILLEEFKNIVVQCPFCGEKNNVECVEIVKKILKGNKRLEARCKNCKNKFTYFPNFTYRIVEVKDKDLFIWYLERIIWINEKMRYVRRNI